MKPIAIVGRWYKDRVGMALDQYVCGFGPNGSVITQSSTGNLGSFTPKFFQQNYQLRPEIIEKFVNAYYNMESKAVNFGQTSYDSKKQAEDYAVGGVIDWTYVGAHLVSFTVPEGE